MTIAEGTQFGPYRLLEKIGAGGMGEVYRVLDTRLEREVALKLVADYEAMAVVAMAAPRLRAMREYLDASGLAVSFDGNPTLDRAIGAVETECQLLKAAVAPVALLNAARKSRCARSALSSV